MTDFKIGSLPGGRNNKWKQFGFKVDNNGIILKKNQFYCRVYMIINEYSDNTTNY